MGRKIIRTLLLEQTMKIFNKPRKTSRNRSVLFLLLPEYLYLTVKKKDYIAQLTLLAPICNFKKD